MPADPATNAQVAQQPLVQVRSVVLVCCALKLPLRALSALQYPPATGTSQQKGALASLTSPVLIIAGKNDTVLPFAGDQALAEALPDASLLSFSDAGHAVLLQHALTLAPNITSWLDQNSGATDASS